MAKGSALSAGSGGEAISHFNALRMRIVGTGSFEMTFYSMDDVNSQVLTAFTLSSLTNREPLRLANFNEQRAYLQGKTTAQGARFRINRIIIFAKSLWNEYPG